MLDPFEFGFAISIGCSVVAMFIRIEHRLTKVETKIDNLEGIINGCQRTSEDHTK